MLVSQTEPGIVQQSTYFTHALLLKHLDIAKLCWLFLPLNITYLAEKLPILIIHLKGDHTGACFIFHNVHDMPHAVEYIAITKSSLI